MFSAISEFRFGQVIRGKAIQVWVVCTKTGKYYVSKTSNFSVTFLTLMSSTCLSQLVICNLSGLDDGVLDMLT